MRKGTLETRWGVFSLNLGRVFSHRAHRVHWAFWRTFRAHRTPSAYREHRGLSTKISCNVLWYRLTQCLCEMLCVLFFCVNLWEIECTLNEKRDAWDSLGRFFSHRAHRVNRAFLRTVSTPQKAFSIQNSQNVIAKSGWWVVTVGCWRLA